MILFFSRFLLLLTNVTAPQEQAARLLFLQSFKIADLSFEHIVPAMMHIWRQIAKELNQLSSLT